MRRILLAVAAAMVLLLAGPVATRPASAGEPSAGGVQSAAQILAGRLAAAPAEYARYRRYRHWRHRYYRPRYFYHRRYYRPRHYYRPYYYHRRPWHHRRYYW